MTRVDPDIARFYATTAEENRLTQGAALLEAARTRELVLRHVPPPPAVVLDIGGGAGDYSFWLAAAGYTVHLIDAAPRLIAEAQRRAGSKVSLASSAVGDARALEFPREVADAVLLLGPLYHLTDAEDRAAALVEARRVLKAGGRFFGAVISRWASTLDGLSRDLFQDPRFWSIVRTDLAEGQHRNPTERADYFTTAYFHRPDEALAELRAAGFADPRIYGIEGPGWMLPDVAERLEDPRRRSDLLEVARALESESSVVGISAHMLVVAQKP